MGAEARIDRLVTAFMARENVPGVALVALRGDQIVAQRGWGVSDLRTRAPMTTSAVQPFYSVSKQITAAVIVRLARLGLVDIEAPVGRYLPEWFGDQPTLLVAHLLRQTSGLPDFVGRPEVLAIEAAGPGTGSPATMLAIVDALPRRFEPGERHAYSNSNFTALALIAERVTGRPFDQLQREMLFAPLNLASMDECSVAVGAGRAVSPGHDGEGTVQRLPPNLRPSFVGAGGVCGNATDLARWTRSLGRGRVFSRALLESIRSAPPVLAGDVPPYGFGLSTVEIAGRPAFSHGGVGDGWGAWTVYLPHDDLTLTLLFNRGWVWGSDLATPIVRALTGQPDRAPLQRLALNESDRGVLGGAFEDGLFEIDIAAEADRILVSVPPFGPPIEMWKQPDGRFVSPVRPDTFVMRLAASGPQLDWAEHRSYLSRR
ncbi:serine hydrolase domain-containing protein [Allosphingosinicella sp.]|uniref:serine hydrolase domain-containing protein n=1 Tax=Allosphingosinicella sp. TaxID=2823234 RepID=UPI002EFC6BFC